MDAEMMKALAEAGGVAALSLAAIGSGAGAGVAGMAAAGSWKKCYAQNKAAPFILVVFIGAPLSQTIYGMILMNAIKNAQSFVSWPAMMMAGILGGIALGVSAWYQGKAGAACADAQAETGQGFGNYLMTIGIVETVALFVLVFSLGALK
jgi:V/A-type H+-transporting ATPase subunit K